MWSVGQRIGEYELLAHLRSGGMATLFLARRLGAAGFTREVAIKIVNPELAVDAQFRTMFLDEAQVSSRVSHPNVVRVEELGEHQGSHYLVMEYVHGASLSQLQRQLVTHGRRLSPAFAARIAMHVAEGLHAAHETTDAEGRPLHIVHRDVTPENILLAYAGHVKLIDFGIAKAYGRRHKTQEGLLKGKFRYMSPEQAYGRSVDRRTDIYQLGIVLWEMLTLRRLFDAETDTELIQQVRNPHVAPPSALVDRIPQALEAAVMCALDPDPARRPADAQTFARMLGRAVPEAYEVDGGTLSALVIAAMHEQREREKHTFPRQVYASLERKVSTAPGFGAESARAVPVLRKYTLEHTSLYGNFPDSDYPSAQPARTQTRPGHGPVADVPLGVSSGPRLRRRVRIMGEASVTPAGRDRGALWLSALGAIAAAGVLAFLTLRVRGPASRAVPRPPALPSMVAASPAPPTMVSAPPDLGAPTATAPVAPPPEMRDDLNADAGTEESEERAVLVAPDRPRKARTHPDETLPRPKRRLARPVDIDGTPLIPEF